MPKSNKKDTNPRGRGNPTKYRPEFCEQLVEHMSKGHSFESFASTINVNRDSLYEWVKNHTDFSDAKKRAVDKNLEFMEGLGLQAMQGHIPNFNVGVWCFFMKNVHRWKDKHELSLDEDLTVEVLVK